MRTSLEYEDIVAIDGMVKLLLEMYSIPYVRIASLSMQERVRTIRALVDSRLREIQAAERAESAVRARRPAMLDPVERNEPAPRSAGTNGES